MGRMIFNIQLAMHSQNAEAGSDFWMGLLRRAMVQLAATPEPLLPWLPKEVEGLKIGAMPTSKDSAQVLRLCLSCFTNINVSGAYFSYSRSRWQTIRTQYPF